MSFILTSDSALTDFKLFGGGKAKHLAILSQNQVSVPPWFCVSSEAFEVYQEAHGLQGKLVPSQDLVTFAEEVKTLFTRHPLPPALEQEIRNQLTQKNWNDVFLAVRSSGLDEDSAAHSFAGLFSSFLYQKGWEAISLSIRLAWASAFSERALAYRRQRGITTARIQMGVVIQKMVNAESAGVLFTRNPIQALDREHLMLESVWGLGEGLVSGELDADHFLVHRQNLSIQPKITEKEFQMGRQPTGGILKKPVALDQQKKPSLLDPQVQELSRESLKLEALQGGAPQDLEWAYEDGKLYWLQMRPITSLPGEAFFDPNVNGKEANLWDNSNIVESFSGVTSPFTFSFASYVYQNVYRQFAQMMNAPESLLIENEKSFRNMLGFIRGRIYYNLINWYRLLLILPGAANNAAFMETMLGVKKSLSVENQKVFDFVKNPPQYGLRLKLNLMMMSLYRYVRSDSIIQNFKNHFNAVYQEARGMDFKKLSIQAQLDYYHSLQDRILRRWQAPIVNDFLCMIFFGWLKKLTQQWIQDGDAGASLQNDLLCGQGDLESTEPTKNLMRIAKKIDSSDPEFKAWYLQTHQSEVWAQLKKKDAAVFSLFEKFLDLYELKLEEKDLHDDPSFVVGVVASYVRMKSYSIDAMVEREKKIKIAAESKVTEKISGHRRILYFWVLKQARKAVRVREDLRFDRTKIYGVVRQLIRAVGSNFTQLGLLENEQDVFYLTLDEIVAFNEGRHSTNEFASLVQSRKICFDDYRKSMDPPDRFVTYGSVGMSLHYPQVLAAGDLLVGSVPESDDPTLLYGTPCCPGIVEGIVRVAHELKETEGMNGEILVTSRTDPGWVPLYPSCSGLLIERGSLLSHSAVVARELGLPAIVGISGGLMKKLKTGQRVRMDAAKGEIKIL